MSAFGIPLDETMGAVIAGILVFISLIALGQAMVPQDPMAARLRSHQKRREQLRADIIGEPSAGRSRWAGSSNYSIACSSFAARRRKAPATS